MAFSSHYSGNELKNTYEYDQQAPTTYSRLKFTYAEAHMC